MKKTLMRCDCDFLTCAVGGAASVAAVRARIGVQVASQTESSAKLGGAWRRCRGPAGTPPKYQQISAPSHSTSVPARNASHESGPVRQPGARCACAVHGDLHVLGRHGDVVHGVKHRPARRRVVQRLDLQRKTGGRPTPDASAAAEVL